ncbi:MAG: hypothetical protein IJQ12_09290 [Lachnospiraceae bacterium]|nr:hypothetical protein [Lachnospiraceae bacterium]
MADHNLTNPTLEVEGFKFLTPQDAEKAKLDASKITYLESHVGYTTATALNAVYEKSIQNKIFSTPVGWSFLHELRRRLLKMGMADIELMPIPLPVSFTHTPQEAPEAPARREKRKREESALSGKPFTIASVACNIMLFALVIVMFAIIWLGETDNMINYKRNMQNRYAEYEQQLRDREQVIREKERELNIQNQ